MALFRSLNMSTSLCLCGKRNRPLCRERVLQVVVVVVVVIAEVDQLVSTGLCQLDRVPLVSTGQSAIGVNWSECHWCQLDCVNWTECHWCQLDRVPLVSTG
ncbi:hypothetical protein IAQ61_006348 [Plenodomus lingam]|uniref:uncharacterized protein n=1 Tax=Leptosphaeria maculans TaxID=5022 RepID=UPI003330316E|nr:hypothetical protein IAQ61_006348 [Plenodomus lingam]